MMNRSRKLSDWIDINEQSTDKKRDIKFNDKKEGFQNKIMNHNNGGVPLIGFAALAAGSFKPKNNTNDCFESIKRLRACSKDETNSSPTKEF